MASVTDTAIADTTPPADAESRPVAVQSPGRAAELRHDDRGFPRRSGPWRISPLTRRILAVNILALALLAAGFLYLGKYEASLIGQQIESLRTQGEIFAAALGEGAVLDSPDEG